MPKHFIYILQSSNGKYYTGYTTNLERRMEQHKTGKGAKFVRGFGFDKLLYHEEYSTKSDALKREAGIKNLNRAKKERLVARNTAKSAVYMTLGTCQHNRAVGKVLSDCHLNNGPVSKSKK